VPQDGSESGDERGEIRMDENWLVKIAKNGKADTWTASKALLRKLDINIRMRTGILGKIKNKDEKKKKK